MKSICQTSSGSLGRLKCPGGSLNRFPWVKFRTDGTSKISTFCDLANVSPQI